MSYGVLSPEQKRVLKPFVARRVVHDLGAGYELDLSCDLLALRAASVVAVDLHVPSKSFDSRIRFIPSHFKDFKAPVRTAFVSWPWKREDQSLVRVLERAPTVIYLGHNFDGTACGGSDLWAHLCARRVRAHVPHPRNTLIIYGKQGGSRELLPEEEAALDVREIRQFRDFNVLSRSMVDLGS